MEGIERAILRAALHEDAEAKPRRPKNPVDHWPRPVMLERAAYLREMARFSDGSASETIREFPMHTATLLFRSRSGEAEVHENSAHLFLVLAGTATLVTGGQVERARRVGPGEILGDRIERGVEQKLRAGELVHVPAGTPYQWILRGSEAITWLVVKVQETL